MVRIYTLTLGPSLNCSTMTPQNYPEGKLHCTAPVFRTGGGGMNVARAIAPLWRQCHSDLPGGWRDRRTPVSCGEWNCPRRYCRSQRLDPAELHVHVEASGEQYRFVMQRGIK